MEGNPVVAFSELSHVVYVTINQFVESQTIANARALSQSWLQGD